MQICTVARPDYLKVTIMLPDSLKRQLEEILYADMKRKSNHHAFYPT